MNKETVILVHGLWMKGLEMMPLARYLQHAGFKVRYFRYPTRHPLPTSARRLRKQLRGMGNAPIHLVAHSLGGLLLCHLADQGGLPKRGRVLMIGTPLASSHSARTLASSRLGRTMLGRDTLGALLGERPPWPADRPLGLIAGKRGFGLGVLVDPDLPRPNDGTVSVKETLTSEVTQHLVVEHSHFGMLWARDVHRQVLHFLRTGKFKR